MIYVSVNGEVLGEFEESAVPAMLAGGKITGDAFYWREGMSGWLPVADLAKPSAPAAEVAAVLPKLVRAPVAVAVNAPVVATGAEAVRIKPVLVKPASAPVTQPGTKPFTPRSTPMTGAAAVVAKPMASGEAATRAVPVRPLRPEPDKVVPAVGATKKRGRLVPLLAGLLVMAGAAGGGVWWWLNAEPPVIPGSVALSGDEAGAVEIRVFRREDLAGPWRERLAAADARSVELDQLMVEAQAAHREKSVLRDEATRVFEVGEEYNMPDLEELRADRDAKEAEAMAAQAALEKLQSEKAELPSFEALLDGVPASLQTMVADDQGNFSLPPPEGTEVVLLATAVSETDGKRERRGWLEVLQLSPEGEAPGAVRFAETNRLDVEEIRRFAATGTL